MSYRILVDILILLIFPFLEIFLLIKGIYSFGFFAVVAWIIATAFWGIHLVRSQGFRTLQNIQQKISEGQDPHMDLLNGASVFLGGALLILPGFLTDFMGFFCIFPPTRNLLKLGIRTWARRKIFKSRRPIYYRRERSEGGNTESRPMKDINLPPEL